MTFDVFKFENQPELPIKSGANFISGYAFKSDDFCEAGIPVVKIKNIQNKVVDLNDSQHIPKNLISQKLEKFILSNGDVLIAMTGQGSVGRVGRLRCPSNVHPIMNQRVGKFLADELTLNRDYLFYVISSEKFEKRLFDLGAGSGQPNLSPTVILSVEIPFPKYRQQLAIAEILNSLDNRITLLRETNSTLEAIAQALFKSWFVDFDPVRAKQEGRQPEGMDAETAALFPDSFEQSELGEIPKGWGVVRIDEILELAYGKALKATERTEGDIPVYGSGGITGFHNQSLVTGPSIIIGRKVTVGSLFWEDRSFFPIDTVFYVKTKISLAYCFYLLKTLGLREMNTDAAVPGLNRGNVYRLNVPQIPNQLLSIFDGFVGLLRSSIYENEVQIRVLSNIRDSLLPRLVSGQLRLPDAEEQLEAATAKSL